ncbi:hypothetical protein WG66_000691 [Moniliophthora roreri]|nr:hypothetical protein WG66_000691 [Moniliophthora roreri]
MYSGGDYRAVDTSPDSSEGRRHHSGSVIIGSVSKDILIKDRTARYVQTSMESPSIIGADVTSFE